MGGLTQRLLVHLHHRWNPLPWQLPAASEVVLGAVLGGFRQGRHLGAAPLQAHRGELGQRLWHAGEPRLAIGHRDSLYRLSELIEVDDAYIGASKTGKTGRGGGHTVRVDIEHHVGKPGLLAIGSVPSLAKPHLIDFAKRRLQPGRLPTPMPSSPSHVRPSAKITPSEEADQRLPWVHLVISNLKRFLLGTYQGAVRPHRLQEYLDESGYRFNRRFWEAQIPNRLLSLSVDHLPVALRGT